MKVLLAPDKFKGSLSAVQAAEAIGRGLRAVWPHAQLQLAPIADGGEGFAAALCLALDGQWIKCRARDPLGREVDARYAWIEERRLAVIEMSEASGLWRLAAGELSPLTASTFGTGQLMRDAMERGARTILVGLGGSATTDGGTGMAQALGFRFLDADGIALEELPRDLLALARIVPPAGLEFPEIIAACDVQNPLLGARGSAAVFAPQKGADALAVQILEGALEKLAAITARDLNNDFRDTPGAGAAGGIGFGLLSFCSAQIRSGFDVVAEALELEKSIAASDLIVTGEGRLDGQTLEGKGPAGVAELAKRHGKPVLALAGCVEEGAALGTLFSATCPIIDEPTTLEDAMARGAQFLERAAQRAARLIQLGIEL